MGDLGDVKQDSMQLWGEGVINDGDGLMLIVQKLPKANTLEVTKAIDDALAALAPAPVTWRPRMNIMLVVCWPGVA